MSDPVFVGGVGGSGTRVIAQILEGLGVHMGHDLNSAYDNLWFHRIFVRGPWTPMARQAKTDALEGPLALFEQISTRPSSVRGLRVREAVRMASHADRRRKRRELRHATRRALKAVRAEEDVDRWGWKEPNTHMFLPALAKQWPQGRYVHLVRHGLDMSYSDNTTQVRQWGPHFGLVPEEAVEAPPHARLRYWVAGNQQALAHCRSLMEDRHLVLRFEDLCHKPRKAVKDLAAFIEADVDDKTIELLASIPKPPKSLGRFEKHDLHGFLDSDLEALKGMGYSI